MCTRMNLEQLPAEILLEIAGWVCCDEINLDMLAVSKRIRSIVVSHPMLQALGAFRIVRTKTGICLGVDSGEGPTPTEANVASLSLTHSTSKPIRDLLSQPWCNKPNMLQLQCALMKTLARREWTPLLTRDGRLNHPGALTCLLDRLRDILQQAEGTETRCRGTEWFTLADTTDGYTWTYLLVWPTRGLVVIRDRVTNSSVDIDVPIVRLVEDARNPHSMKDAGTLAVSVA